MFSPMQFCRRPNSTPATRAIGEVSSPVSTMIGTAAGKRSSAPLKSGGHLATAIADKLDCKA